MLQQVRVPCWVKRRAVDEGRTVKRGSEISARGQQDERIYMHTRYEGRERRPFQGNHTEHTSSQSRQGEASPGTAGKCKPGDLQDNERVIDSHCAFAGELLLCHLCLESGCDDSYIISLVGPELALRLASIRDASM